MPNVPACTRFAPSPTGHLHLGNARTALFNFLQARASDGRFILRVEDTDARRSDMMLEQRVLDDLSWLGLVWDEGPDIGGAAGPYRQSERRSQHEAALRRLHEAGLTYPCFCTPEELRLSRRAQLGAGRAPRYAGTCASLAPDEVERRQQAGQKHAIRFRVEPGRVIEFDDAIHGLQRFATDDIGDFVIVRADGSAAFFLGNAVDDAAMNVNFVLRGDDHLANTPRQMLLLEGLGLPMPLYGHLPLLLGPSGKPLSKREGAISLRDLRAAGYLPGALRNYLVRLGHACDEDGWLELDELPDHFDLRRSSRSPAHFDEAQLRHWQREALLRATTADLIEWLGESRLAPLHDERRKTAFVEAVRGNLLFPADADRLLAVLLPGSVEIDEVARAEIVSAGPEFFVAASAAWQEYAPDFRAWVRATGEATGCKGKALYMPLRSAVTGATHGPELAPLIALMEKTHVAQRLAKAEAVASV